MYIIRHWASENHMKSRGRYGFAIDIAQQTIHHAYTSITGNGKAIKVNVEFSSPCVN